MPPRVPNTALATLLRDADWTIREFIGAVNRMGSELGIKLNYDETAATHWLRNGVVPRAKAHPAICEALGRRLGRPVTVAQAGIGTVPTTATTPGDTVAGLIELGSADMDPSRRAVLGSAAGLFSTTLTIPGYDDVAHRFDAFKRNPRTRIGHAEVAAVTTMTRQLIRLDDQFGGRNARPMAAAFLVNTIAPYLKADAAPDVTRAMLSAAADHAYLTGWMAMDEREDGIAQQYFVKALELASGAEDRPRYCRVLRGMSVHAIDLGHTSLAVRTANAAAEILPKADPRFEAFLAGQQAHVAAASGDRRGALTSMRRAEAAVVRAERDADATFGSYTPSALRYHISEVRAHLGDLPGAIREMEQAQKTRDPGLRRTRIRYNALLAERKLRAGRLEDACQSWHAVLDEYPAVQSGRCDDRVTAMTAALRPHRANAEARLVLDRARAVKNKTPPAPSQFFTFPDA
ncbi:tetratricopeptide repeat protein [Streptomyces sp. NPDC006798]|uniref:tetratricopeptide repeat protein n=1 Tax=Streptomyces sp. NPDC006798 TaxID=3155462 RepID=UPI0033C98D2F